MQIKAGLRKEIYMFVRTFRMAGIIIAVLGLSILDPLIYKAMFWAMDLVDTVIDESQQTSPVSAQMSDTVEIDGMTIEFGTGEQSVKPVSNEMAAEIMLGEESTEIGVLAALSDISSTALLILLLIMMSTAGGELKKRALIIPNCAGLTSRNYLLPKFIFYPTFIFVLTTVGGLFSSLISYLLFGTAADMMAILCGSALIGLYMAFLTALHLTFGICTAKPGISAAVLYVIASILPIVLNAFNCNKFNPFSLSGLMGSMLMNSAAGGEFGKGFDTLNLGASVGVTIGIIVVMYFITLLTLSVRKIDNSDNEIAL